MASLQELLSKEGFEKPKTQNKKLIKPRDRLAPDDSIALPIYICHDRKSLDSSKHRRRSTAVSRNGSSKRVGSSSERVDSISQSMAATEAIRGEEPAIDEVAIRAVISILSGYIGRYTRDEEFRETIREKYNSCLAKKGLEKSNDGVLQKMELGIQSIEKLVGDRGSTRKELRIKTLRNSIHLLSIVASLNSKKSRNGSTCGTPNCHLSACAQLYLSIVYKLEKNDRICSRHLLQVFCDAPFLARTHLLPELWEHLFLPHLLHLKVWYSKELDALLSSGYGEKEREKQMKVLSRLYNENVDYGTIQFALYYKDWLKVGSKAPALPQVALPSRPISGKSRRMSSDSNASNSSINKSLYRAVFGPTFERHSMDLDSYNGASTGTWRLEEEDDEGSLDEESYKLCNHPHDKLGSHRRSSSQISSRKSQTGLWPETQKRSYLGLLSCQGGPTQCTVAGNSSRKEGLDHLFSDDVSKAISTLCSSDILSDCESAIRVITRAWLDSHHHSVIETALMKASVIEGMLEVLFASNNDEILELVISVLAEFITRKEVNGQIILNSDPQLEIFIRLLRNSSLFLKAAVLLHLLKPKAKHMISIEWVPLVLRVLEFGHQMQTLFTVRHSPQEAALYFLDRLLTGFDEDMNLENARQVVSVGGLSLLVKRIEVGNPEERIRASLIISCCTKADGSCRNYLADNLNKAAMLELIVMQMQMSSSYKCAFSLLTELLCLDRRSQITKFLYGLKNSSDGLNTMQILFAYIQKALPEELPLVASVLLQLDLLGEPLKCSVYREEAVEAIIAALDCQACNEKVQQQSARALLILGGHFSYTGEATVEKWMLRKAGFDKNSEDLALSKDIVVDSFTLSVSDEEEDEAENWQRKAAIVLLNSGNKRFLAALSNAMVNAIPSLARASLATVAWISYFLHLFGDENFRSMACSVLMPSLLESLNYDKDLEERVLASHSLLCLVKSSECAGMIAPLLNEETTGLLRNLSLVTWTATELMSILKCS